MVGGRGEENRDCVVEGLFGERENRESILDKFGAISVSVRQRAELTLCYDRDYQCQRSCPSNTQAPDDHTSFLKLPI